jgi:hypothetical protein
MLAFGTLAFRLLRINPVPLLLLSAPKDKKENNLFGRHHIANTMAINESFVVPIFLFPPLIKTKVP